MKESSQIVSSQSSKQELIDENEYLREELDAARHQLKFYKILSTAINIGYWEWDTIANRAAYFSEETASIMGMSLESFYELYQTEEDFFQFVHPDDQQHVRDNLNVVLSPDHTSGRAHVYDYRIIRPNGEVRFVRELEYGKLEKNGVVIRTYGAIQDITDHQESIRALKQSEQRYSSLFSQLPLGVQEQNWSEIKKRVDKLRSEGVEDLQEYFKNNPLLLRELLATITVVSVNDALLEIYGAKSIEEYIEFEENIAGWLDEEWANLYTSEIAALAGPDKIHHCELEETRMDGSVFETRLITRVVEGDEDNWQRVLSIIEDVTERKEAQDKLNYQARHDSLTGLINRNEFERRAGRLISAFQRSGEEHALCFMDLDQFKIINDTCGHAAGDNLLHQLGEVLQSAVRHRDTLARIGGDEFGVLMEHCTLDQARRVAMSLQKVVQDFLFTWESRSFRIGVSIGLVAIDEGSPDLTELMRRADAACYMAKDLGRDRIHVYRLKDSELAQRHGEMQWVTRISQSLEKNQFCLYAQPIVPLDNSDHWHYEFLLRMIDETGKAISPGAFFPAAERYGMTEKLDRWVVEKALTLLTENPAFITAIDSITINLSGPSFTNQKFLNFIISQLDNSEVEPEKICFEVTETVAISNLSAATKFIKILKGYGCFFALDDFGSGLSSFGYLRKLPVDYLKIDGMFVREIANDPIDYAMVKSINDIGQIMGMKTIAEFVENDAIKERLQEIGVNYAQGYSIGKPRPFTELLVIQKKGKGGA